MEEMQTMQQTAPETEIKETVRQGKKFFSKMGLMYFLGALFILVIQMGAIGIAGALAPELMTDFNWYMIISMAPMYLIGIPILILLVRTVPKEEVTQHSMSFGKMFVAFIMCVAIMYCSNIVGTVITSVISLFKGAAVDNVVSGVVTATNPLLSIVIMVICAPIAEELVFRKLLIDRAVRYGEGTAVLLSGLLFGLFHGNLSQFAYAFTLGLFLGFIYVKTGKVRYSIILHMLINFIGSVLSTGVLSLMDSNTLLAAMESGNEAEIMSAMMGILPGLLIGLLYILALLAAVITGVVLLIVRRKRFCLNTGRIVLPKGKRFSTVIWNVGMMLYCVFWIGMIVYQLFM